MSVTVAGTATRLGDLAVAAGPSGVVACVFGPEDDLAHRIGAGRRTADAGRMVDRALAELTAYLAGGLQRFTVPVDLQVPAFDHQVLRTLDREVGYGRTTSYGDLARSVGLPASAARAVGRSLGANPVLVIIPCHRVVGVSGALTGYAAGLSIKRALLDIEAAHADGGELRLL